MQDAHDSTLSTRARAARGARQRGVPSLPAREGWRIAVALATVLVLPAAVGAASAPPVDVAAGDIATAILPAAPSAVSVPDVAEAAVSVPAAAAPADPAAAAADDPTDEGTATAQGFPWPDPATWLGTGLEAAPSQLVFHAVEGESCETPQTVSVVTWNVPDLAWQVDTAPAWLQLTETTGVTPSQPTATVDCASLTAGIHHGELTLVAPDAPEGSAPTATVALSAIMDAASPVTVATWKDGRKGAFSSSTDDSQTAGYAELLTNGAEGTFVVQGDTPPADYAAMHASGMEIGSHLVSHYCEEVGPAVLKSEIEDNIEAVVEATGSLDEVSTLVWPCGFRTIEYGVIAADYFVSARGYYINELEDATPSDLMNLKGFNSHEHQPAPEDLKTIVDDAEAQGKWANLVLHAHANDDGAIHYATTRDVWVAPIGDVVAYILQRDRTIVSDVVQTPGALTFDVHRLPLPASAIRDLEATLDGDDEITLRVDVTGAGYVSGVEIDGEPAPFEVRAEDGGSFLYVPAAVSQDARSVEVAVSDEPAAPIAVSPESLEVTVTAGAGEGTTAARTVRLARLDGSTPAWTAEAADPWVSVPAQGTAGEIDVRIDAGDLEPGAYASSVTVSVGGVPSQSVAIVLTVLPEGTERIVLDYPDRDALAADGWDFLARTAQGSTRDTEATSGRTVSYAANGLRVPADAGDLWGASNDTRNTLFRDLPETWTSAQVRLAFSPFADYQLSGLAIYGDDDEYVQVTRAYNSYWGGHGFSLISESGGVATDHGVQPASAASVLLRVTRDADAATLTASASSDDGATWEELGTVDRDIADARLAIVTGGSTSPLGYTLSTVIDATVSTGALAEPSPEPTATPTPEPTPSPSPTGGPGTGETAIELDYADRAELVADGWDFLGRTASGAARDTEHTTGHTVSYSPDGLGIPADAGDLWGASNDTRNTLFRDLPETWTSAEVELTFAPTADYQHAGIVIYGDDDHYVELTRAFNSYAGGDGVVLIGEEGGTPSEQPRVVTAATALTLRIDRDPATGTLSGFVSVDGGDTWQPAGSVTRGIDDPRLAVNVAGSTDGAPTATVHRVVVVDDPDAGAEGEDD